MQKGPSVLSVIVQVLVIIHTSEDSDGDDGDEIIKQKENLAWFRQADIIVVPVCLVTYYNTLHYYRERLVLRAASGHESGPLRALTNLHFLEIY